MDWHKEYNMDMYNKNITRGNRNSFVTINCWDFETGEWVIKTLDFREPIERYIPEYIMQQYDPEIKDHVHNIKWFVKNWSKIIKEMFAH
jgi:hypothetical protein